MWFLAVRLATCVARRLSNNVAQVMSDQLAKRPDEDGGSENEVQRKASLINSTSPKTIFNYSTQKFSKAVDFVAFVDKTLFIKAFIQNAGDVIVTLAPPKFGKSTNMDMVKEFVKGNKKLFRDNLLKIYTEEKEFFNKYCKENPIIYLDFKNINCSTKGHVLQSLREIIRIAFNDHRYLIEVDRGNYSWSDAKLKKIGPIGEFEMYWKSPRNLPKLFVETALKDLSQCLNLYHGKPVFVFIDDYDVPIMKAMLETSVEDEVLIYITNLISAVMSTLFTNNEHIKKGLINASVHVAEVLPGHANNIRYYEFLKEPEFSPYFGFTDEEVNSLFERDEFVTLKNDEVQKWYNGYKLVCETDYVIYNSWSVLNYLRNSKRHNKPHFDSYWVKSGSIDYLKDLFTDPEIWSPIQSLIDGNSVEINTISTFSKDHLMLLKLLINDTPAAINTQEAHLFLQFLTQTGYLNIVSTEGNKATIVAPNNEMKKLLRDYCYNGNLFQKKYQLHPENICNYQDVLLSLLQKRHKDAFRDAFIFAKAVSMLFDGAVMPYSKLELHSILFTLAYNIEAFDIDSKPSVQRTKSTGRPPHVDIFVIWNDVAMIMELKFKNDLSDHACNQARRYDKVFDEYSNVKTKIIVGLYMNNKKQISLTYTVDDSNKETVDYYRYSSH